MIPHPEADLLTRRQSRHSCPNSQESARACATLASSSSQVSSLHVMLIMMIIMMMIIMIMFMVMMRVMMVTPCTHLMSEAGGCLVPPVATRDLSLLCSSSASCFSVCVTLPS